ncbi:MAG: D-alanine--D-alanine ligase [Candidatus Bipolaricaulis sibiricus]|uniref:D-alanine--D-alanine ligase n=1 Tax=Bipolaricaulis sibiricus TaxID=2501609 RepID=A0A410FTG6_BIPS1|nr:MAG: D-alanine--D-alanine ligase [Candidatus Bipolaricaulis sibiricus]
MMRGPRVAVLCGGDSAEREISLLSGHGVHASLVRRGWDADLVILDTYDGLPQRLAPFTAVFNVLHGGSGEDGTAQLLLDLMGKPYVGSGPLASALAMDKVESRRAFQGKGLPVPEWVLCTGGDLGSFVAEAEELGYPLVVKPRREGSSIGLHLVRSADELGEVSAALLARYGEFLAERFLPGREVTASVLERDEGAEALPLIELRPKKGELFDWQAKYSPGECTVLCPAPIEPDVASHIQNIARQAHEVLGCRDLSRADFRLTPDGVPHLLEVNTLPGFTEMSLFPRAAGAIGMSYDDLVVYLLNRALRRLPSPASLG